MPPTARHELHFAENHPHEPAKTLTYFGPGTVEEWGPPQINSTFAGNSGVAIFNDGTLTVSNSIVAPGGDCTNSEGSSVSGGHNLIEDATNSCGLTNGVNGNLVGVDPLLGLLANNGGPTQTIALQPGSPAINAGDSEVCANPPVNGIDQRGFVRPGIGHTQCSIGAYEADGIPSEACTGDCNGNGIVAINELVLGVNIVLGRSASACLAFENAEGTVDVAQLVKGVNNALNGCGG